MLRRSLFGCSWLAALVTLVATGTAFANPTAPVAHSPTVPPLLVRPTPRPKTTTVPSHDPTLPAATAAPREIPKAIEIHSAAMPAAESMTTPKARVFLEDALPKLKAARSELDAGTVTPARRTELEGLVASVQKTLQTIPPSHETSLLAYKAESVAKTVTAKLNAIQSGTLRPPQPDLRLLDAVSPIHAPRLPEAQVRSEAATWMEHLEPHREQADTVRPLFELLKRSGYGAREAADLLASVLADENMSGKLLPGGWHQSYVEDEIFRLAGYENSDVRPQAWGTYAPPAAPTSAKDGEVHPQTAALLREIGRIADTRERIVRPRIQRTAERKGISSAQMNAVRDLVRRAPIHIRFRLSEGLLNGLERDPTWKNVHETGTTGGNSNLLARTSVERGLGFRTEEAPAPDSERPKYGYLNITNAVDGQASHYGDATLILKQSLKSRSSLCFGDSFGGGKWDPPHPITTFDHPDVVIAPIAQEKMSSLLDVAEGRRTSTPYPFPLESTRYVEVQIFGKVDLRRDVAAIVLGPEAAASPQRARLVALGKKLGIPVLVTPKNGVADVEFTK